jgi:hypothetical protein
MVPGVKFGSSDLVPVGDVTHLHSARRAVGVLWSPLSAAEIRRVRNVSTLRIRTTRR